MVCLFCSSFLLKRRETRLWKAEEKERKRRKDLDLIDASCLAWFSLVSLFPCCQMPNVKCRMPNAKCQHNTALQIDNVVRATNPQSAPKSAFISPRQTRNAVSSFFCPVCNSSRTPSCSDVTVETNISSSRSSRRCYTSQTDRDGACLSFLIPIHLSGQPPSCHSFYFFSFSLILPARFARCPWSELRLRLK